MARVMKTASRSVGQKKGTARAVVPPEDQSDENNESESSEEFSDEDEDSDYGNSRKKGKAPPAKRAKKSSDAAPAKKSPTKGSRQKKSLSMLPNMPLDVLFEVFSHLTPRDIIHLSRTSRIFRDTLMTRNATTVWKGARERLGAPECPSNMCEPQWAVLLFGHLCQSCGAKNIPRPEFALLRRICTNCKKNNYLVESRFKSRFLDVEPGVLELIPYTNFGAWSHGYVHGNSRFFWIADIHAMLRKLAEYEHNIHLRRPGAQEALQDFKCQQVELVESIRESICEREEWCEEFSRGRYNDKHAMMDQRFEAIQSKFIELGYKAADVEYIRSSRECQQPALLTDRIWNRIRPILEPTVLAKKGERLERELRNIRSARRQIVHKSYREYQKTLTPSQWKYLPRTVDVCALEPFVQVVDAEGDVTVTAADFEDAFRELPGLIATELDARKGYAKGLLKVPMANQPESSAQPELGEIVNVSPSSPDPLELATAVFKCLEPSCTPTSHKPTYLFGWDAIATHHCKPDIEASNHNLHSFYGAYPWFHQCFDDPAKGPGASKIMFSDHGSEIAASIVRVLGLDEKVATVQEVDEKTEDIRFGCSACPTVKPANSWRKAGYRWREFVMHCAFKSHNPKDVLELLSPEVVTKVKQLEMADHQTKRGWTCGHCSIHLGDMKQRQVVVEHLKSAHAITSPREPTDLFFFARNPSLYPFEVGYPVESPGIQKTLRCLECANGKPAEQKRLFDVGGVRNHLDAKHKVKSPVAGVHYR